jgi:hypothetical protein
MNIQLLHLPHYGPLSILKMMLEHEANVNL